METLDDFDFEFQPSVDQKLVRELATGRFIALGRAAVETNHTVLFVSATTPHRRARRLDSKLTYFAKPKLLNIELGYLLFEERAAISSFKTRCSQQRPSSGHFITRS